MHMLVQILLFHLHKAVTTSNSKGLTVMDLAKYQPIARMGGESYGRVTSVFEMKNPEALAKRF